MIEPDDTDPAKESLTVEKPKIATWAQTWLGWIPGSSYVIGVAPSESPSQGHEDDEPEPNPTSHPGHEEVVGELVEPERETTTDPMPKKVEEPVVPISSEEPHLVEEAQHGEEIPVTEREGARLAEEVRPTEEERAVQEEEGRPENILRRKFKGVAAKLIATLGRLNSADFKKWPETDSLKKTLAGYRSVLKKNLAQSSHREIASEFDAINAKLDEADSWATEQTARLKGLFEGKMRLTEELEAHLRSAGQVAIRGDLGDAGDVKGERDTTGKNAAAAFAVFDFEKLNREIQRSRTVLDGVALQIEGKFAALGSKLASIESGDYFRVHRESPLAEQGYMETALARVRTALASGTLTMVEEELRSLRSEIKNIDSDNQDIKQARERYPGIAMLYGSIKDVSLEDLAEEKNKRALAGLKRRVDSGRPESTYPSLQLRWRRAHSGTAFEGSPAHARWRCSGKKAASCRNSVVLNESGSRLLRPTGIGLASRAPLLQPSPTS